MRRFAATLVDRLQATRLQLLDVYGHARDWSRAPPPGPGRWCPSRSRCSPSARTPPTRGRSSSSRARSEPLAFAPGPVHDALGRRRGEVPISISGDPDRPERLVHTVRAVGLATEAICAAEPGRVLSVRGPFGAPGRSSRLEGADVVIVAGGIGLAPLRPAILCAARAPRALRPARAALRRTRARPAALHRRARRLGGARPRGRWSPSTAPARSGSATSASSPAWSAAPGSIRRRHVRDGCAAPR